jgi:hypothetical protein
VWDETPLAPADILDALTDALPNLAIHYVAAVASHDEVHSMVLEQAIVDLVGRQKARPTLIRGLVEMALQKGLAPHVDQHTGDIFWIPVGQFPETFPADALDVKVLSDMARNF